DSDGDSVTGLTPVFVLSGGEDNPTYDMGLYPTGASIGNYVWQDLNQDGIQDAGEPGIASVKVYLKDNTGTIIDSTLTDGSGMYAFTGLAPGDYTVQFVQPTGYGAVIQGAGGDDTVDSDGNPATGETATITLAANESNMNIDMGYSLGSIGDYVWLDTNQDGVQDVGEAGIDGVKVYLLDGTGTVLDSTITAGGGLYNFGNLPAGQYQVKFVVAGGYSISPQDATGDSQDSDADALGLTPIFTLGAGENNPSLDMGLYQPLGSIGDYVWEDTNQDGVQDGSESGISGVKVYLLDELGAIIDSTTTNMSGGYAFVNVPAGNYQVQFVIPSGYSASPQTSGTTNGSDGDATGITAVFTLNGGENNPNIDMGMFGSGPCNCSDIVGVDTLTYQADTSDIAACLPLELSTAQLYDIVLNGLPYNSGLSACAEDTLVYYSFFGAGNGVNGPYHLDFWMVNGVSISGDFLDINALADSMNVWDPNGSWIVNGNTVSGGVWNPSIYGNMDVTTTGTGQLTHIQVNNTSVFTGSEMTIPGTPGVNTVVLIDTANTCCTDTVIIVVEGATPKGSIGDYVWMDTNGDGIQDATESGIGGVTVELLDGSGTVISTTTTDNTGFYSFTNLDAGDYQVHFILGGQNVSPQGAGGDATKDSDTDSNGYTTTITLGVGENNMTIDAGILPCNCSDIIGVDTLTYQASLTDIAVCLPMEMSTAQLYDIVLNGLPYNSGLSPCAQDTLVYYSLFGAGNGVNGPYHLDSWDYNGTVLSGDFADIDALADSMNVWDPNGAWVVDGNIISGGIWNPSFYGNMEVTTTGSGQQTHIEVNRTSIMTGSEMTVPGTPGINTVVLIDTANTCCRDTVIIIVEGQNTLFAKNDVNQTEMNTNVMGHVLTNDLDPEGNTMSVNTTLISQPAHGTVAMMANGTYVYMPDMNYTGHDVFEYQVCDDGTPQVCDTAQVDVTIFGIDNPDNNPPVGIADHYLTTVDNPVTGSLLPNDSDPDGDSLTINTTPVVNPTHGAVVINPDGTYTYTPNTGFEGLDEFAYEVCDNGTPTMCDTVVVTIDVLPNPGVNVTVATDDAGTGRINEPITGSLTANDTDPESNNQAINTIPISNPTNGTVVLNPDGTYTYTPDKDFVGNDQFEYAICDDGTPQACDTATVYLTVMSENTIIARNDINQTLKNVPVTGVVVTNDEDPQGDAFTVDFVLVSAPSFGTVSIDANGLYTYTPNMDYVGEDVFTYRICDNGSPQACDTADVYISIIEIDTTTNNPPIGVVDNGTTLKDVPLSGQITTNDGDPDGDGIVIDTIPVHPPSNGTVHINPDGSYVYVPNPGFVGQDTFFYMICDNGVPPLCDTSLVIMNVLPSTTDNLVFANDDAGFGKANTIISGSIVLNDFDPQGDTFSPSLTPVTDPAHGSVTLNADGTYDYTPNQDYTGNDQFIYAICDSGSPVACDTATVYLTIFPAAPDQPVVVAVDDVDTTTIDTPVGIRILDNDMIPQDIFDVNIIVEPTNGTVVLDSLGFATYTPNPGYCSNIPDEFQYEICDAFSCDTAIVQVYVQCSDLEFVSGFSPNGDGINDAFVIKGASNYPDNVLHIYNRWGNLVFEKEYYDNTWSGTWFQGDEPVPDGTYFYVWENGKGKRYSGYVEIHR
ncbi:MAG TPA: tandem-95 repeat protein, partial [Saprospiraceae bacterium]|nr:tandem-95 repeat protein [Saprospiraceae bacterium]